MRVYSPITRTPAFPPTGDLIDLPAVPVPGRPEYRIGVAHPAARAQGPSRLPAQHLPRRQPGDHRPPRRQPRPPLGPAGDRLGPHPLRDLSALLRPGLPRAARARGPAALLPPLRRHLRAVQFDGAAAARPEDELRRRHLVARHRPRDLQSRRARPRLAARPRHRGRHAGDRLRRPAGDGKGARRLLRHDRPARPPQGPPQGAGGRRRAGARLVREEAARRGVRRLPGRAPTSAAPSPRWTCCSTRRSPRRSAT